MKKTPTDRSHAFWITGPRKGELRSESISMPTDDQVQVRTLFSGISRGTETLVWRGEVPQSQYDRLRAPFQSGDFPWPVKYGYISVGAVEQGPFELEQGTVFCLHPHQTRFTVPISAVTRVPDEIPAARAVLAANMETAINAVWDGRPQTGDAISVIGAGVVGCLVAWLINRIPGTSVQLIDINGAKADVAAKLGIGYAEPDGAEAGRDIVFHASGNPDGLATALSLAGEEGQIVELSWYGNRSVNLPLGEDFHSKRLQIISSQVGRIPAYRRSRWTYANRMELALSLLKDPTLDTLISGEDAFDDLPAVFGRLDEDTNVLCHRIRYG